VADGDCSNRILRGGSWSNGPGILCSADRGKFTTDLRNIYYGFRVGRTLGE
jgi:formylglycine-generating enzyme required for sulfatase activity